MTLKILVGLVVVASVGAAYYVTEYQQPSEPEWETLYRERLAKNYQEDRETDHKGMVEVCAQFAAMDDAELRTLFAAVANQGEMTALDETLSELNVVPTFETTNRAIEIAIEMARTECPSSG